MISLRLCSSLLQSSIASDNIDTVRASLTLGIAPLAIASDNAAPPMPPCTCALGSPPCRLLCLVHDAEAHRAELVVLDAAKITAGPVARVRLPHHVPYASAVRFTAAMGTMFSGACVHAYLCPGNP